MLQFLAFGLGVGAAIQGFRNFPADGPASPDTVIVLFLLAIVCAYLGGRRRRPTSVAVAVASAEANAAAVAQNRVQVVVMPGNGAGAALSGVRVPGEGELAPSWIGGRHQALELDQLDGMEAAELVESIDYEGHQA